MFDQHPSHPQSQLYTTAHQSSLTLGSLHQHTDHSRGSARGQGISLETKAAGNLQGASGLHITSYSADTHAHMSHHSHRKLQTADQQQLAYSQLAEQHQPVGLGITPKASKEDAQTPFALFNEDTNNQALESGQWAQPHILIDSQHNLALLTGQHSQHTSTQNSHSHAVDNTYYHSQTQLNQIVAGDIHYYSNKAQTHTAAHGDVTLQAHTDEMRLDSEQVLRIHSRDEIEIIAPDTLSLKAAGSGIEMSGGNVTLITPAQAGYKASKVDWGSGGGESRSVTLLQSELADGELYTTKFQLLDVHGKPMRDIEYLAFFEDGEIIVGVTNIQGKTQQFQTEQPEKISVHFNTDLDSGVKVNKVES